MQIGMVGLGRMGGNMARRLMRGGHKVVAWARNAKVVQELAGEGAVGTTTLDDFVAKLAAPRVAWVMVPAGAATEQVVMDLARRLSPGDTLIDGGNSYFKDDVRRSRALRERRINYLDVGTSGGVWGLERGYCLMIGGDRAVVERLDPIFRTLAPGMGTISRTPGRETQGGTAGCGEGGGTVRAGAEGADPCDVRCAGLAASVRWRQGHGLAEEVRSGMRRELGGRGGQPAGRWEEGHDDGAGEGTPGLVRQRQ